MLFNSYTFIFAFLPIAFAGFLIFAAWAPRRWAILWLVICSLFFYGWWQPRNLWILGFLLLFNFSGGLLLGRTMGGRRRQLMLIIGLTVNIGILCYFKYANFLVTNLNSVVGTRLQFAAIALPLGISFFIFQKIAYLVDASRGRVRDYSLTDYSLFVTFFPQLIAGPIVHHSEVVPQFSRIRGWRLNSEDLTIGSTLFIFGLFKKVVIADQVALYVSPIFNAARDGVAPGLTESWIAALAYTFQIYFDFSGYSDMALGLARLFGIKLPANFNSPYKATNVTEFWRRWHMTLSRFLRDYVYIPLGGNRKGPGRRYVNLMATMLLGGLWHGAGWTFVFWGGLHGMYLTVNQAWMARHTRPGKGEPTIVAKVCGRVITFFVVLLAWVFFRSPDFVTATRMFSSMAGLHGLHVTSSFSRTVALTWLGTLWLAVLVLAKFSRDPRPLPTGLRLPTGG